MEITVKTYGDVRAAVGEKTVTREFDPGTTVSDVLDALAEEFDVDLAGSINRGPLLVMKNGTNVKHLDGNDTPLSDGDTLGLSGSPMPEGA